MTVRYYIVPVERIQHGTGPKYLKWRFNPAGMDVKWSFRSYGKLDQGVLMADVDASQHAFLAAQADVYAEIPADLGLSPSPQELSNFEAYLEGMLIPADWLNQVDSWRLSLRTVWGMVLFMRRLTAAAHENPFDWGYALNTRLDNMTPEHQFLIREAFVTMDYDDSIIRDNWTIRVMWKNAADQWGEKPIYLGNDSQGQQVIL